MPEDGDPEGITHRMTGLRARELEEAPDGQGLLTALSIWFSHICVMSAMAPSAV